MISRLCAFSRGLERKDMGIKPLSSAAWSLLGWPPCRVHPCPYAHRTTMAKRNHWSVRSWETGLSPSLSATTFLHGTSSIGPTIHRRRSF
jgi:hypothetical protein